MNFRTIQNCGFGLLIVGVLQVDAVAKTAQEQAASNSANWSGNTPPEGWAEKAYSPNNMTPDYGSGFNPDGSPVTEPAEGEEAAQPPSPYDAFKDPFHPLKNPTAPPKEWVEQEVDVDEDGDGQPDLDADGNKKKKTVGVIPKDQSPPVRRSHADVDWGERYYGSQFDQYLFITNKCGSEQPVQITVTGINTYVNFPKTVMVSAGETKKVTGKVKLPEEPSPPINIGMPGAPGWGWVQYDPPPPGQPYPLPKMHQPNFVQVEGEIETWHPWAPGSSGDEGDCLPKLTTFTVTGHIHFRPPPPEGGGPSQLATPDVCEVYWLLGVPPAQLGDTDCTEKMRELASHFVAKILVPYIQNAPDEWLWLPDAGQVQQMSISELLALKARADSLMGWQ